MKPIESIELSDIQAAHARVREKVIRTPLVKLNVESDSTEIYLKLENLQPIGSFKVRGAGNAMGMLDEETLAKGVYTASAGNMAQGVGWVARELNIPFQVVVPDHAPNTKLQAIERLGGDAIKVPFDQWWQVVREHKYEGLESFFIHPVCNPNVIAGNGTIGLEIVEDLPDLDAVIVPYGGGGLVSGIGSAIRALCPHAKIFAGEVATATPLANSLKEGRPCSVEYQPSFVDGIGGKGILEEMWPIVQRTVDASLVVELDQVANALRLMMERNRVIAEGAGAVSVAAALAGLAGNGKIACVISGGNIDNEKLVKILDGKVPD